MRQVKIELSHSTTATVARLRDIATGRLVRRQHLGQRWTVQTHPVPRGFDTAASDRARALAESLGLAVVS